VWVGSVGDRNKQPHKAVCKKGEGGSKDSASSNQRGSFPREKKNRLKSLRIVGSGEKKESQAVKKIGRGLGTGSILLQKNRGSGGNWRGGE